MRRYYFVTSALPPLYIATLPSISFDEFVLMLEMNLTQSDLEQVKTFRRYYDILNVRNFLSQKPFIRYGNMHPNYMQEALNGMHALPDYFAEFLQTHQTPQSRLHNFPSLLSGHYAYETRHAKGFLRDFLTFDHQWRIVFTALRTKALGRNIHKELEFEDPSNPIVKQLLLQKDSSLLKVPEGFEELADIYNEYVDSPLAMFRALFIWGYNKIEERLGVDLFSIERVLGYMAQLIYLEKLNELDQQKGLEFINSILRNPNEQRPCNR